MQGTVTCVTSVGRLSCKRAPGLDSATALLPFLPSRSLGERANRPVTCRSSQLRTGPKTKH